MQFDRLTFFDVVRTPVFGGHMTQGQVDGLDSLLSEWEKKPPSDDLRTLAYCLGTAFWETGKKLQPVEEIGKGKGHAYGNPTGPWHQVYDGRGDVQLTWLANYTKATACLHADGLLDADLSLAETPSLALRPDLAAAILYLGCLQGWFTGKKLGDYFTSSLSDWVNARRVVNGTDHASTIAGYAMNFLPALTQAAGVGATAAVIPPAAAAPVPSGDPAADVLASIEKTIGTTASDTLGSIFAPASPSPGDSAPQPATEDSPPMNPLLIISIIQQVMTYAPTVEHILSNVPDIVSKGEAAIQALEKLDFATATADAQAIFADIGITQQQVAQVVSHATKSTPPAAAHT